MAALLEIIGWIIILGVMLILVVIAANMPERIGLWVLLIWALPAMFGGLVVIVFARLLAELQAIRAQAERQTNLLTEIAKSVAKPIASLFGREGVDG